MNAKSSRRIPYDQLSDSDLFLDAIYLGGTKGNAADDPISKLLGGGNQGGFRFEGSVESPKFVVLYTSGTDLDWPDSLDETTGTFTYFGDNKRPGHELHDTSRSGNAILRNVFSLLHADKPRRDLIPPFFAFQKAAPGRSVAFKGLLAPESPILTANEDLAAIWRSTGGERFQNYKAVFSVLNIASVSREWLNDLKTGEILTENCPGVWREWVTKGTYRRLVAAPIRKPRPKEEQLPVSQNGIKLLSSIREICKSDPTIFEHISAELIKLMDSNVLSCDVTRPWKDGGRDALGSYRIGLPVHAISVNFALEAKCYASTSPVGVKECARLIARLRYRQFGIFVTTSYFASQACEEIWEDEHPVVLICGRDIVEILEKSGITSEAALKSWIESRLPA